MRNQPGVSLYIPCYNAVRTIQFCLESVLRQSYPPDEVLLIDDGSTDGTAESVSAMRIRIIRHGENRGLAAARNTAVSYARGEFLAALDADCVAEPQWLEKLMNHFERAGVAGAGGRLRERYVLRNVDLWRSVHMKQEWGEFQIAPRFLFGSNTVFRRAALQEAGLYDLRYRTNYEDCDMSLRLKEKGWELVYEPQAVVHHLRSDTVRSLLRTHWRWTFRGTTGTNREPLSFYNVFCKVYDNLCYLFEMLGMDLRARNFRIIPIDLLIYPDHCIRDLWHYLRHLLTGGFEKKEEGAHEQEGPQA